MGHREVDGLVWAKAAVSGPFGKSRARGVKALGVRYESSVLKALSGHKAVGGKWFEFWDKNGHGWCQPDIIIPGSKRVLVLEAKHSWVAEGHTQIDRLYRPVVESALGKEVVGIVVCKYLREMPKETVVCSSLREALAKALEGAVVVLAWNDKFGTGLMA